MRNLLKLVVIGAGLAIAAPAQAEQPLPPVMLFKNPQCGCCEGHAAHLRKNGFSVTVKPTHDLATMSREAGIADEFQGCHLAFIDGYVVSGHVPAKTIRKLITERPPIRGITLPGMPMGSPGMNGDKQAPFEILEIGPGAPNIYAVE